MSAILAVAAEEEQPRLYSKQERTPVDVVAAEHRVLHNDLERWGQWNREGRPTSSCQSVEGECEGGGLDGNGHGGRETRRAVVSLPTDPRLIQIEAAVVRMMADHGLEPLGESLREFYCKRWPAKTVCWAHALRFEGFARWMYLARQALAGALGVG